MGGWEALGYRVAVMRARRGWSAAELATRAGLSLRTIEHIEAGDRTSYRPSTLARLDAAMGWQPGSALRIVEGMQPQSSRDPLLDQLLNDWFNLTHQQRVVVATLAETLARRD